MENKVCSSFPPSFLLSPVLILSFIAGSSLDRLWGFVLQFLRESPLQDNLPDVLDDIFKSRLWTYFLCHDQIILKAGDQILKQGGLPTDVPLPSPPATLTL